MPISVETDNQATMTADRQEKGPRSASPREALNTGQDYLKIGRATELSGRDYRFYRLLEMLPGFLSLATLFILLILSYLKPVWIAYFIIAFDVYWLLLVVYMAIFLINAYRNLKRGLKTDWRVKCEALKTYHFDDEVALDALCRQGLVWDDLWQIIIMPTAFEDEGIIRTSLQALLNDGFPREKMIVAVAFEERAGAAAHERAEKIEKEFRGRFGHFLTTFHPDSIVGEIKGKGSNQTWSIKVIKEEIIDWENLPYDKILVSVFDVDTAVRPGYFFALSYKFLTATSPYRASYQPVPVYQNNIWRAPFFSRVAATSNTFWQMIMQVRQESLVTYSSHSMTFKALAEIGFWSPKMVSEDSRIFWHCLLYYNGDYRVEPIHHAVSMDITCDQSFWKTVKSLYKQQRRWAWGAENIPFLIFNARKRWRQLDKKKIISHIFVQIYGFHSWATNALIIAVIGWMPMLLGGSRFNTMVLSGNLPLVTQIFMNVAMVGLFVSAIISGLLLPKRPKKYSVWKNIKMALEWFFVPVTIIFFGAIPCLDAQIHLLRGRYMGFWVTPKERK